MPLVLLLAAIGALGFAVYERERQAVPLALPPAPPPPPSDYFAPGPTGNQVSFGGSYVDELAPQGINDAAKEASNLLQSTSQTLSSAIPIIGGVVASIAGALLAQHTARLQGAKTENQACAQTIPAWRADFETIALSNSYSKAYRIAQAQRLDAQTKTYLRKLVGKPGTAWNGAPTGCPGSDVSHSRCVDGGSAAGCGGPHPCDKTCTVSCCIYYNYLEPALDCLIKRIAAGGVQQVGLPAIPGNKYGFPNFPAVTVTIAPSKN